MHSGTSNPTLCGQQKWVRLQRLSDYGVTLAISVVVAVSQNVVTFRECWIIEILDYRGSTVMYILYVSMYSVICMCVHLYMHTCRYFRMCLVCIVCPHLTYVHF